MKWLNEKVNRVPPITDEEIRLMRHIRPVLRDDDRFYRVVKDSSKLHPRNVSFLWNAEPDGMPFTFGPEDSTTIITQHHSCVFFKPSLAEVYAWIRVYMPETWGHVEFFWLDEPKRVGASTDYFCKCVIMGGDMLVRGEEFLFANGEVGHTLKKYEPATL